MINEELVKELLFQQNDEFRQVFEEHQACERKLEKLREKKALTEEDSTAEKELKKKKLVLKDKMYQIMSEYARNKGLDL